MFFMTGVETTAWAGCMRVEISERPSTEPFCSLEFAGLGFKIFAPSLKSLSTILDGADMAAVIAPFYRRRD